MSVVGEMTAPNAAAAEAELTVRVRSMTMLAEEVLGLELVPIDGGLPAWEPGSHIDLLLPDGIERQYSLCGEPEEKVWRIAVKRVAESRGGSAAVHERVRPGDTVGVRGPRSNFSLVDADRYVFIAGGIGITPIVTLLEAAVRADKGATLHYAVRSEAAMAFADRLRGMGGMSKVYRGDAGERLPLDRVLASARDAGAVVYACGPTAMLDAIDERCSEWPSGTVHVERFASTAPLLDPSEEQALEVVLQRSGRVVAVPPEQSILEGLEAEGIILPYSCREGVCGTCETAVIEGEIDHRDVLLSPQEREAGDTMMICVSRAKSSRLVLDL